MSRSRRRPTTHDTNTHHSPAAEYLYLIGRIRYTIAINTRNVTLRRRYACGQNGTGNSEKNTHIVGSPPHKLYTISHL